jgi:hypothetical protein
MPAGEPHDAVGPALERLERFLDTGLRAAERAHAINDPSVPDRLILAFLNALGHWDRVLALALCWRPEVLATWSAVAGRDELSEIARNPCTPIEVVQLVLAVGADEQLRADLACGHARDADVAAWLLADPSPRVRDAVREALGEARFEDDVESDQQPGNATTLAWLHEAVPATQVEDLLRAHLPAVAVSWRDDDEPDPHPECEEPRDAGPPDAQLEQAMALIEKVFRPDQPWDPA